MSESLQSAEFLAKLFGFSPRTIRNWANAAIIPKEYRGRFNIAKCIKAAIQYWWKAAQAKRADGGDGIPVPGLTAEREARLRVQRQRDELRLARERGDLIPVEEYKRELSGICTTIRERLRSLPPRIAPELEGLPRSLIERRLAAEIDTALGSLSNAKNDSQSGQPGQPPAGDLAGAPKPGAPADSQG